MGTKVDRGEECGPFQCGLCKREEGIYRPVFHHLPVLKIEK